MTVTAPEPTRTTAPPGLVLERKAATITPLEFDDSTGRVKALVNVTGIYDHDGDRILPGAHARSLKRRMPKGLSDHDLSKKVSVVVGAEEWMPGDPRLPDEIRPGVPWPAEAGALYVEMEYILGSSIGRDAYETVKAYSRHGQCEWSIGYAVPPGKGLRLKDGRRDIQEIDDFECSDVIFGASPGTTTLGVKSASTRAGGDPVLPGELETKKKTGGVPAGADVPDVEVDDETQEWLDGQADELAAAADGDGDGDTDGDGEDGADDDGDAAATPADDGDSAAEGDGEPAADDSGSGADTKAARTVTTPTIDSEAALKKAVAQAEAEKDPFKANALRKACIAAAKKLGKDDLIPGDWTSNAKPGKKKPPPFLAGKKTMPVIVNVFGGDVDGPAIEAKIGAAMQAALAAGIVEAGMIEDDEEAVDEPIIVEHSKGLLADGSELAVKYDEGPIGTPGGKQNWVDKVHGLPKFIRAIAHALIRNGRDASDAIAIAVATVKRWAAGGGKVTAKTRAKAAAAVAEWEAKKAESHMPGKALDGDAETKGWGGASPYLQGSLEERQAALRDAVEDALSGPVISTADDGREIHEYRWISIVGTFDAQNYCIVSREKTTSDSYDDNESWRVTYEWDPKQSAFRITGMQQVELQIVAGPVTDGGNAPDAGEMTAPPPTSTLNGLAAAASGMKVLMMAAEQAGIKAGRVLSATNEAEIRTAVVSLVGVLRKAGVDIEVTSKATNTPTAQEPQQMPTSPDTTSPGDNGVGAGAKADPVTAEPFRPDPRVFAEGMALVAQHRALRGAV